MNKKKSGRPVLDDKRDRCIRIYVNSEEKDQFENLLKASMHNKMGVMLREIILQKDYKVIHIDPDLVQERAILITQCKKIGVNFNEFMKMMHSKKLSYFTNSDIIAVKKELQNISVLFQKIVSTL